MKLKLTKIEFTSGNGDAISLTTDEARELYQQLHELFGDKKPGDTIIQNWPPTWWSPPWWYTMSGSVSTDTRFTMQNAAGISISFCGTEEK